MWSKYAVAILLLGSLAAGCGLFTTRSAEDPDGGQGSWETPRVPIDVLTNMTNAMFERNELNYLRSFYADDFMFEADPVALADDPALSPWHYEDEAGHIRSLLSAGTLPRDSILFVFFRSPEETILQDSAEIFTPYELTAGVAISAAPRRLAGTAHFYLRMGREGYWQIYRWVDRRTQDQDTWSNLKSFVR